MLRGEEVEDAAVQRELAELTARCKSNTQRLGKLEENVEAVRSLATSVAVMAQKQGHMAAQMEKIALDVEEMKLSPGKRWTAVTEKVLFAVLSTLVGFVLARLGLS